MGIPGGLLAADQDPPDQFYTDLEILDVHLDKVNLKGTMEECPRTGIPGGFLGEATMAENESLNLGRSRRWQAVVQAVAEGVDTNQTIELARKCLCRTLRAVRKQIPFDDLLNAACNCPDALPAMIRECKLGRDYALLFERMACPGASREEVLVAYQEAVCTTFFDQIRGVVVGSHAAGESAVEIRERLEDVREALGSDFRRIASNLAANPDCKIAMPRSDRRLSRVEQARDLLGQSLLAGCLS